jgi:hypothetical protein
VLLFLTRVALAEPDDPQSCGDREVITITVGLEGTTYEWTEDPNAEIEILDQDGPSLTFRCPECSEEGERRYDLSVVVSDEAGTQTWAYSYFWHVCEDVAAADSRGCQYSGGGMPWLAMLAVLRRRR